MLYDPTLGLTNLVSDIKQITDAGGTVPDAFHHVYEAYRTANQLLIEGEDTYNDLRDTVLSGSPSKVNKAARHYVVGLALAKNYDARNQLARDVRAELLRLYSTVASTNYEVIRQQWQQTAAEFVELSSKVDTNAPAETILHDSVEARTAWEYAPVHARDLDIGANILTLAARMAGVPMDKRKTDELQVGLTVDATGLKRRDVWAAWDDTEHRCGRWGALLAVGARLRTVPLDQVESYRRPRPIETRYVPGTLPGSWRPVEFDPEEEEDASAKPADTVAKRLNIA